MNRSILLEVVAACACLSTGACQKARSASLVVGTWLVHDTKAPFPMHMYVFNADGTMQQANPDAGDAHGSDGKGVWMADGGRVRGKWVEVMADRATHKFTGRGEYSFELSVSGDHLSGSGTMHLFDAANFPLGAIPTAYSGERVKIGR